MKKSLVLSTLIAVSFFLLNACTYTTGEGPLIEREFTLEAFSGVELDGSFDVNIEQGASQQVIAVGQENIIKKLKLNVVDDILYVSLEPGTYLNYDLDIRITIPDLEKATLLGSGDIRIGTFAGLDNLRIELDGSGDIKTNDESVIESTDLMEIILDGSGDIDVKIKAADLKTALEGSGDIDLEGMAKTHKVGLDGSGDIHAYNLETLNTEASLDGSGSIRVFASKNLKASLDGSGDITYKGEPKVEASIDGSGTISAK